jgi:hypothetical protein
MEGQVMRGRWPAGPEYIDKLQGSVEAKERLKGILDTMFGQARLLEVCARQNIGETRFHQQRVIAMQAAVTALEPRPAGRPSRASAAPAEQIRVLEQRVQELEQALHEAQVREEIALVLPHLQRTDGDSACATAVEKKTRRRRVKIRKSR